MDIFKENSHNFSKNVINDLYKLCKSSYKKEQLKLHQSLLGVKGGAETALSPTFSCNAKHQYL